MSLLGILPRKKEASRHKANGEILDNGSFEHVGTAVPFETDLHIPCRVSGITRNGPPWEGDATTLSVGSYGAHLLLPADISLEGDIKLVFKVPAPLRTLFVKKRFSVDAEVKTSGGGGPSFGAMGRKVVCVVFPRPIFFRVKNAGH
jgi:hypothetical protein